MKRERCVTCRYRRRERCRDDDEPRWNRSCRI